MESKAWLDHFSTNRDRPRPSIPARIDDVPPALVAPLVRSLQRFQLGEAGEGRVAREAAQSRDPALDEHLRTCVDLYVREEGRHARELAAVLRALGAPTLRRCGSEWLFERTRRMLGLRTKMMTIAAAEVCGVAFYGIVRDRVPSPAIARVAAAIAADEAAHLAFQMDYLRRIGATTAAPARAPVMAGLVAELAFISCGAMLTVAVDHRPLFAAVGVSTLDFWSACRRAVWTSVAPRAPEWLHP
jgi:hypothetical protein